MGENSKLGLMEQAGSVSVEQQCEFSPYSGVVIVIRWKLVYRPAYDSFRFLEGPCDVEWDTCQLLGKRERIVPLSPDNKGCGG